MPASLVDFHCHLDLYPDHAAEVRRCEREGVFTLAVTTTPLAWKRNQEMTMDTKCVRAALGIHPQLVAERATEISLWEDLLPMARYVGEVGLDAGPRYYKSLELQKAVFERVLRACASAGNKILTIHSVRAAGAVLDMIECYLPSTHGLPVLHWFTGSAADARRAVELGCYFSVNSQMLSNDRSSAMVRGLPLSRILTETDGPFTKIEDRPARPDDVRHTLSCLAESFGIETKQMQVQILRNLQTVTLFGH